MKKWEIIVIVAFFAVFVILFFSVEQPWEPKTSKVGETVWIEDMGISVDSVSVADYLNIRFDDGEGKTFGYHDYEAGARWKFVILDMFIYVAEDANDSRSFGAGALEDDNGMTYDYYSLFEHDIENYIGGTPYCGICRYEDHITLPPGDGEFISVAYKIPTNAVPEKFHYWIYNSHPKHVEVILKK